MDSPYTGGKAIKHGTIPTKRGPKQRYLDTSGHTFYRTSDYTAQKRRIIKRKGR
jgi:hypothetical protein